MKQDYFEQRLKESLGYGFIHNTRYQDNLYAPSLVMNNQETGETVLTELQNQFDRCQSFFFNVAFISQTGIAMIKSSLHDLGERGVRGRLLISPYLDFNDPDALYELLKIKNLDVRMTSETSNMHAKVYLFDHEEEQVVIAGSSNLTHTALKQNYEWNIKLTSSENGEFIHKTHSELEQLWEKSFLLTEELIKTYKKGRKQIIELKTNAAIEDETEASYNKGFKPNKMQEAATKSLAELRSQGAERALVISATGTGKTYLSAFDVKQYQPDKMLFIVHREQILRQAMESFQKVLEFQDREAVIYRSGMDISEKKYVFATIQTLSKTENLNQLPRDLFDYILIDEVHRAGAQTYQKAVDHFQPNFLLGMTATPERTDDYNIFEMFHYNIAYEIRLQGALEEDMLAPFIYYGVTEMRDDQGYLIDDDRSVADLISDERVDHILDKIHYYSLSQQKAKGLIFCGRKQEAKELSDRLNDRGFKTKALSGGDKQEVREATIKELEDGDLDYILTVDIFNEGVDIPKINQVIMLRQTQSSIIFVQQLGRGLRKHPDKEFVTVIDFIGNYKNNYMIPMALFGDESYNKDNYRRDLVNSNQLSGITTINFEKIARQQIFDSIQTASMSSMKNLGKAYRDLKNRLGRIPLMMDFIHQHSLDPIVIFENSAFKNYSEFVAKMEKDEAPAVYPRKDYLGKVLFFVTGELMSGKRPHELILFQKLIENRGCLTQDQYTQALEEAGAEWSEEILESVHNFVSLEFFNKPDPEKYGYTIIHLNESGYQMTDELQAGLSDNWFVTYLCDAIKVGLHKAQNYEDGFKSKLQIGQKYSRKDVSRLLNFGYNGSATMFGYSLQGNTVPIFINYHKTDKTNSEIKYEDALLSDSILQWYTKSQRKLTSKVESKIINHQGENLDLHLFIKKDDLEDPEYYYFGKVDVMEDTPEQMTIEGKSIVRMLMKLRQPVPYGLYQYFINE